MFNSLILAYPYVGLVKHIICYYYCLKQSNIVPSSGRRDNEYIVYINKKLYTNMKQYNIVIRYDDARNTTSLRQNN